MKLLIKSSAEMTYLRVGNLVPAERKRKKKKIKPSATRGGRQCSEGKSYRTANRTEMGTVFGI